MPRVAHKDEASIVFSCEAFAQNPKTHQLWFYLNLSSIWQKRVIRLLRVAVVSATFPTLSLIGPIIRFSGHTVWRVDCSVGQISGLPNIKLITLNDPTWARIRMEKNRNFMQYSNEMCDLIVKLSAGK
uniref:Uncharacterized protein MANES_03G177200 n=1 Tax=Rhizophora mucronata TaxID=61149 RepID=A0A2P2KBS3_RHIMU